MRRWNLFIAALCLTVAATAPVRAAVQFKGLQFSAQGACVVDVASDGMLEVSNIGSSGLDGVSIDCTHMDGAMLAFAGQVSAADAGSSITQTYRCSLNGLPPGTPVFARSAFVVSPSSLDFSFTCSPALSSASTQTVTLYRAGVAVYSAVVDASTPVSITMDPATGWFPSLAMGTALKRTTRMIEWRESSVSSMSVTVAGHHEDCDDFTVARKVNPGAVEVCDGSSEDMRFVAAPGSSLTHVRCSDGACRALDHWVQGAGAASVAVSVDASSRRRLEVHNLGSSGNDGVSFLSRPGSGGGGGGGIAVAAGDVDGDGYADDCVMSPPSLVFAPALDDGASAVITVVGNHFSSSTGTSTTASVALSMNIGSQSSGAGAGRVAAMQVSCDHSSLGSTAEWATVLSHGEVVASVHIVSGSAVSVTAPPGGTPVFAVASCGVSRGCCNGHVILIKTPQDGVSRGAAPARATSSTGDGSCSMEVSFRCARVFTVGGQQLVGDQLVISGDETGTSAGTFQVTTSTLSVRCPNPGSPLSSLRLLDVGAAASDVVQPVVGGASITPASTCVSIPFSIVRLDATPARAFSVTFHLSAELATCGASVVEGDYLSSVAGTQLFTTDNGGGSFTVDCGILGPVCGATGSGRLFTLQLSAAAGVSSGMGSVVVDAVTLRDCSNQPVPASPGATGFVPVQLTSPPPLAGLSAVQVKSGNPQPSSTTGVQLSWSPVSPAALGLWLGRKGYDYYAAKSPALPTSPSDALARGWSNAACISGRCSTTSCSSGACTTTGMLDQPPSRDFLYYVAFVIDAFGNASPVSNMTAGTLDYHLGDVSDGSATCSGDDHVDIADVSLLGSHYGTSVAAGAAYSCLDVGPTTDFSVDGRPLLDGKIGFEDFMMFAINFSVVSSPRLSARPMAAATDAVRLTVPATLPAVGSTFDAAIAVDGAGNAQGMSVRLDYDHAVLEQVGVASGALLDAQGRAGLVLSSGPGDVDAALLGAGPGIAGSGELARVTFRVKSAGDANLALAGVSARDVANHPVPLAGVDAGAVADARTGLGFLFPNPFHEAIEIRLSLRRDGPAKLAVYDVAGRKVRVLLQGVQPAGARTVSWDGRDDAGLKLASGAYLVRLEAAGRNETRTVRLVR